jgi:NitT/TauT family transport system substrate-binding protein
MTTPKKRSLIIIAVIILVTVIILSSFVYLTSQRPFAGTAASINVGMYPNEYNSLIYLANDQQYFKNNGLNVTITPYASGTAAVSGMLKGESDIALASEFAFTSNILQNASICTVGAISSYLVIYVVARTDKGINSISDLEGKTIGVAIGTNQQFYLGQFLQLNGVSLNQVTLQNIAVSAAPTVLANGTVDAVVTFQPYINQIQGLLGNQTVMWSAQGNQPGYNLAISTTSWTTAHPDLVTRFLNALNQAANFNTNHKDEAIDAVAKNLNNSITYESSVWSQYQYSVTLDQSLVLLLQQEARWLISNNLTTASTVPNFTNYIYIKGLETVSPESVNIAGLGD